ncbi:MAG: TIGR03960 family B12-binding radical SAM protein [Candidatus Sumerlaeaceae bacterium]|nr:TIGR03960 family B12-binding radical SAM protein [Candidatus Sumerlaeaceae bacterium]
MSGVEMDNLWNRIEPLLLHVEKPARYCGGELNIVRKPDEDVDVRIALAFPDLYELGMSYHGFKILYELVNSIPHYQAERTFAPAVDFEALLREQNIPLYTLESFRPLAACDVVGFSLQHEMGYTNVLNMLDLGRIPVLAKNRSEADPLIIAGGHGAFNAEPLADFVDAFVIGDGEWALLQILETVRAFKRGQGKPARAQQISERADGRTSSSRRRRTGVPTYNRDALEDIQSWLLPDASSREDLLLSLARIPGVYVPRFYECLYNEDGTLESIRPNHRGVPEKIQKTNYDLRSEFGSVRPVVPLMRVVHDRFAIEIKRGCMTGCRFCQAGMITRPLRERSPQQIIEIAREGIRNTGYEEISLLSLSSADYSQILSVTRALQSEFSPKGISISLPSLRINAFDVELADEIAMVRKTGFTFAPEAGTERLRRVINKVVDEEKLIQTIETVLQKGWRTLKFYFMCGLPTETDEDLDGIVKIAQKAIELGKRYCGRHFQLNISLSPFVPKPQTPFQWHAQATLYELERKYAYVESKLDKRYVSFKKHNVYQSVIEGVLSRADRRVGRAICRAWQLGCKFDNWDEHFRYDLWEQAFYETGIAPQFYAHRERERTEVLPWDHIEASLGKDFLWREKEKAEQEVFTPDCSTEKCAGCSVCDFREVKNVLSLREDGEFVAQPPTGCPDVARTTAPVMRHRLTYAKNGALRFISHLDFVKVVTQILRRAEVPFAMSQGYNPQARLEFAPPLPLGFAATADLVDVWLTSWISEEEMLRRLVSIDLTGLEWKKCEEVPLSSPGLGADITAARYEVSVPLAPAELETHLHTFQKATSWPVVVEKKRKVVTRDLKQAIRSLHLSEDQDGTLLHLEISLVSGEHVSPIKALESILGRSSLPGVTVTRTGFLFRTPKVTI